jgi:hypothetical protein
VSEAATVDRPGQFTGLKFKEELMNAADTTPTPLSTEETRVLQELRLSSLPGYALLSKTGLNVTQPTAAANALRDRLLVRVTGELTPGAIRDSMFSVPIDMIGEVDILLGNLRPMRQERFLRR